MLRILLAAALVWPMAAPAQGSAAAPAPAPAAAPAPPAAPAAPRAPASGKMELVDRIVAVVNNEVITQFELSERIGRILKELSQRGTPLPPRDQLERQVLERMILDKVQLQLARDTGLRVDDLDLDRTIARIAESNNLSLTEFRTRLERDGIAFDKFREDVRTEIILSRLREREVDNKITVAESEIDNFLADQADAEGRAGGIQRRAHPAARARAGAPGSARAAAQPRAGGGEAAAQRRRFRAGRRGVLRRARRFARRSHGVAFAGPAARALRRGARQAAARGRLRRAAQPGGIPRAQARRPARRDRAARGRAGARAPHPGAHQRAGLRGRCQTQALAAARAHRERRRLRRARQAAF